MEKTLEVLITPEDFKNSKGFRHYRECPLANSLKRMFPEQEVHVTFSSAFIGVDGTKYIFDPSQWGSGLAEFSYEKIDELAHLAKESLEGIPTVSVTLELSQ